MIRAPYAGAPRNSQAARRDAAGAMFEREGVGIHPLKFTYGMLQRARALGVKVHTVVQGSEDFPFGENKWDLIVLSYVGFRDELDKIVRATAAYYLVAPDALSGKVAPASEGRDVTGLTHHSDKGVQYVAVRYTQRLAEAGIAHGGDNQVGCAVDNFRMIGEIRLVMLYQFVA